jgi:undecaprenyl diphosphate synthase
MENWRRPKEEVQALMHIYAYYLVHERPSQIANNVRLRHLGRRQGLPESVLHELDESTRQSSANTGMHLCLALNYGSRDEIIDAVVRLAQQVKDGTLQPDQINEQMISDTLDSRGIPDPDLLIRTAGEKRISNFLLWQISYAEFYLTDVLWPDFGVQEFRNAILAYANRHRRFGGLDQSNS